MFSVAHPPSGPRPAPAETPVGAAPAVPVPADLRPGLPEVDIRAVAFHRWRPLKWRLRFTEPGAPGAREARTPTYEAALQLARQWSLSYRAGAAGSGSDAARGLAGNPAGRGAPSPIG